MPNYISVLGRIYCTSSYNFCASKKNFSNKVALFVGMNTHIGYFFVVLIDVDMLAENFDGGFVTSNSKHSTLKNPQNKPTLTKKKLNHLHWRDFKSQCAFFTNSFFFSFLSNVHFSHVLSEVFRLAAWEEAVFSSISGYKKSESRPRTSRQSERFPAKWKILQSKFTADFLLIWHQRISMTRSDANFMYKHKKYS